MYYEQALVALEHVPDSRAASEQAIDLRLGLRITLNVLGAVPERTLDHLRRAETLAQTLGDQLRLGWVYAHMNNNFWAVGDVDRAIDYGQLALALAATLGDVGLQAPGRISAWVGSIMTQETMHGPSRVLSGMWRLSTGSCSMSALAPMAVSRHPPGPG